MNDPEEMERINEKISKLLAPIDMGLKSTVINKGNEFSRELNFERRAIALELYFRKGKEESSFVPLVSVFFNGQVVWDDYLNDETLSFSLKSEVGENTLIVAPVNRSVILRKITYRFED